MQFEFKIALRYLCTDRKEGVISIVSAFSCIGIMLGVAILIIVMSVMNGYEVELIGRILGMNGHIAVSGMNARTYIDYMRVKNVIASIQHVKFAAPVILEQAMITTDVARGIIVRAMDGNDLIKKPIMKNAVARGSIEKYTAGSGIFIGSSLAKEIGADVGSKVKLIAPKVDQLIFGMIPRMKTFEVVGIFDVGMYEYNSNMIFMPLKLAQLFFGKKDTVTEIEVTLDGINNVFMVQEAIAERFPDLQLSDWTSANQSLVAALRVERNVMFLILSLIILIAVFNIVVSLIMLVQEKKKSIAILRTIGATKASIVKIFMIAGFTIGMVGTMCGCIIGVMFTLNIRYIQHYLELFTNTTLFDPVIYFLTTIPANLMLYDVILIIIISLLLSFLATIYPALKAAMLLPAVALRYE